jgi:hypothetical protein
VVAADVPIPIHFADFAVDDNHIHLHSTRHAVASVLVRMLHFGSWMLGPDAVADVDGRMSQLMLLIWVCPSQLNCRCSCHSQHWHWVESSSTSMFL